MDIKALQLRLRETNRYAGEIDGLYGRQTREAVRTAMTDGPDTVLSAADIDAVADRLGVAPVVVRAVTHVESAGAGFSAGRPVLLFEPHRFSRATARRFDATYPAVSYPRWDRARYPKSQQGRYEQLVLAVGLDVDAGFASASYGRFQILGENHALCGYDSPFAFAEAQAFDEATQLRAFEAFIRNAGLLAALRQVSSDPATCEAFCRGYNGTAFRENNYHGRIAAFVRRGGA